MEKNAFILAERSGGGPRKSFKICLNTVILECNNKTTERIPGHKLLGKKCYPGEKERGRET